MFRQPENLSPVITLIAAVIAANQVRALRQAEVEDRLDRAREQASRNTWGPRLEHFLHSRPKSSGTSSS